MTPHTPLPAPFAGSALISGANVRVNGFTVEQCDGPPPPRHWIGLSDVDMVSTKQFEVAQVKLQRTVEIGGIAAISGLPGNGKTFSVDYFLHHHPAMRDRQHVWLTIERKPTTKAVTLRLMLALGMRPNPRDSEYILVEDLIPALQERTRDRPLILCLDEAQNITTDGLQQLRYFHDRCRPERPGDSIGWTLFLVGSTVDVGMGGAAELSSRVTSWVHFEALKDMELVTSLRSWHPLMKEIDPRLLLEIDHNTCRGNWRNWAQFLAAYLDTYAKNPPTTDDERHRTASIAVTLMKKRMRQ